MLKNSRRFIVLVTLCFVSLLAPMKVVYAQSDKDVVFFNRVGFVDPEDRTGKGLAKSIGRQIRKELASTFRFEIIPYVDSSKTLPLSSPELSDFGVKNSLDGFVVGRVSFRNDLLEIEMTLLEAKKTVPFAREFIVLKNYKNPLVIEKGVRAMVAKVVSRIPYQGIVTDVKDRGGTILLNVGRLQGLQSGMSLRMFRIEDVKRNPFTQELIEVSKVDVGELVLVRVDDRVSVAKPSRLIKGQVVTKGLYVSFKPSDKVLAAMASKREEVLAQYERKWMGMEETAQNERKAKEEKQALIEKQAQAKKYHEPETLAGNLPKGSVELQVGISQSNYSMSSDQLKLDRKISTFPLINFSGEYWVVPVFGIDADYQAGFIKLRSVGGNSTKARARPYWYAVHFQYRYILWPGTTNLELISRLGYAWYTNRVSETDSQFLTNTRYRGPSVGLKARLSLTSRLTAGMGVDYLPSLRVDEHPVTSGQDSSSSSIRLHVEGRYRLGSGFWLSVRYLVRDYIVTFSGTGSRAGGLTGAKSKEDLGSLLFGFVSEF